MANIKSAKKRILVNQTKYERNKAVKSAVKTAIKKVEAAVAANDKEAANTALVAATKLIEMAGSKGIYNISTPMFSSIIPDLIRDSVFTLSASPDFSSAIEKLRHWLMHLPAIKL